MRSVGPGRNSVYRYGNVSHTALPMTRSLLPTSSARGPSTDTEDGPRNDQIRTALGAPRWGRTAFYFRSLALSAIGKLQLMLLVLKTSARNLLTMDRYKSSSLGALIVQTSLLALTIRFSRIQQVSGSRYLTSTTVVMSEVIKLLASLAMASVTSRGRAWWLMWEDILDVKEAAKVAIPSGIYTFQNNLQFIAVSHLDATTFQVTYQLKILTTAVFSAFFLRRRLDVTHWGALLLLTVGVIMVQLPRDNSVKDSKDSVSPVTGLTAVLFMCLSSGFAGVYFEKILKSSVQSLWAKNVQMAFFSAVLGVAAVWIFDFSRVSENGFFQGYNILTAIIILQQAGVGLIVSLVIKYADNILKGFASSVSIILTMIVSHVLLHDLVVSWSFVVGTAVVVCSVVMYNADRTAAKGKLATVV